MLIAYPQSIWSDSGRNNKKTRKQHPARSSALLTHKLKRHAARDLLSQGGPRRGVGRCGLPLTRGRGGPSWLEPVPHLLPLVGLPHCDPTEIGVWEIGCPLGCAGGKEISLGSLERFVSKASSGARVIWGFSEVLVLRARKVGVGLYLHALNGAGPSPSSSNNNQQRPSNLDSYHL
eukprot:scaffold3582_cov123-Isochrysis_galbana.AAC.2